MLFLKNNIIEILSLIGIVLISIGFFMLSLEIGFIGTGLILIIFCYILWRVNREGGD